MFTRKEGGLKDVCRELQSDTLHLIRQELLKDSNQLLHPASALQIAA